MKYATRSAVALITSGLLAGGALGAVALTKHHNPGQSAAQVAIVDNSSSAADGKLATSISNIMERSSVLHDRMLSSRGELAKLNRQLRERRAMSRAAALASGIVAQATLAPATVAPPPAQAASAPAPADDDPSTSPSTPRSSHHTTTHESEPTTGGQTTGGSPPPDDGSGNNGGSGPSDD